MRLSSKGLHLHDIVLPHVGEVTVAVACIETAKESRSLVDVMKADQAAEAVQEVGVTERPEDIAEDGRLVRGLGPML